jgi:hypothetical protein
MAGWDNAPEYGSSRHWIWWLIGVAFVAAAFLALTGTVTLEPAGAPATATEPAASAEPTDAGHDRLQ